MYKFRPKVYLYLAFLFTPILVLGLSPLDDLKFICADHVDVLVNGIGNNGSSTGSIAPQDWVKTDSRILCMETVNKEGLSDY